MFMTSMHVYVKCYKLRHISHVRRKVVHVLNFYVQVKNFKKCFVLNMPVYCE